MLHASMNAQVGLSSYAGGACTCHLGVVCRERELREDIAQMTDQLEKQKAVTQKTMQVDVCNTAGDMWCGTRGWVQWAWGEGSVILPIYILIDHHCTHFAMTAFSAIAK